MSTRRGPPPPGRAIGQLSSRLQLYTGIETKGPLSSVKTTWSTGPIEWGGFVPEFLTLRNYGAGEVPAGTREIELGAGSFSEAAVRGGIEVLAGPEAGTRWRVVGVDRSNPKRTMVRVEPFAGDFTP